jgi:hypothetical protein
MLQDTEPVTGMSRKGANPGRLRLVKTPEVRGSGSFRIFCFSVSVPLRSARLLFSRIVVSANDLAPLRREASISRAVLISASVWTTGKEFRRIPGHMCFILFGLELKNKFHWIGERDGAGNHLGQRDSWV